MRVLVFDSGVGGLSIVDTIRASNPDWTVDYAADAGFFPYGLKTDDELKARLPDVCAELVEASDPDVLVIACNTASTLALEDIRARVSIPVVGTVPAIKPAAKLTKSGVIGVLATPGTVRRAYLEDLINDHGQSKTILRHGSSELVELAERAVRGQRPGQHRFDAAVAPLFLQERGHDIDVVVLACTHFPLVKDSIAKACLQGITLIDTGEAIARQTAKVAQDLRIDRAHREDCAFLTGGRATRVAYAGVMERFGYKTIKIVDV